MPDTTPMTASDLLRSYRERRLSPVEVIKAALERIEYLQPRLNAFYEVHAAQALREAKTSEQRWLSGNPIGALDGVPTSIKDALLTRGSPTYRGSAANDAGERVWNTDAPSVARLRESGAIILGRTTMPDFGILASGLSSKHGITRNPWKLDRNPGGSSAGAAASIAAGINPIAVGTDIVGSIRLPASFCGIFGHKPSQGRVPYYFPNSPALVAGPMARTVEDAALLMNVLTMPDNRDFTALPRQHLDYLKTLDERVPFGRIGVLHHIGFGVALDPEVAAAFEGAVELLGQLGFETVTISSPFRTGDEQSAEWFYRLRYFAELARYPAAVRALSPIVKKWSEPAARLSAIELYRFLNAHQRLREQTVGLMDGVDFLVLPTVPVPPYAADLPGITDRQIFEPWANTFLFNLSEQPAASIPCGLTSSGLPVGLQIVGRRFDDEGVLRISHIFERARGAFPTPPPI